jgi:hypothetical protein
MFSEVREHVDQRVSHLSRRRELPPEPAIGPERTFSPDELVHVTSNPNRDAPDSKRQSTLVARFDDEVNVVVLHGVVENPEALWGAPIGAPQSDAHRRQDVLAAKRAKGRT